MAEPVSGWFKHAQELLGPGLSSELQELAQNPAACYFQHAYRSLVFSAHQSLRLERRSFESLAAVHPLPATKNNYNYFQKEPLTCHLE